MNNFEIYTDDIYSKLQQAYKETLHISPNTIQQLYGIICQLQFNNFKLPSNIQNELLLLLSNAYAILEILSPGHPKTKQVQTRNNPFYLIQQLATLSLNLTAHNNKSPFLIICLKANKYILRAIQLISSHLSTKTIKISNFI